MTAPQKVRTIAELYILAFIREQHCVEARNLYHHWANNRLASLHKEIADEDTTPLDNH